MDAWAEVLAFLERDAEDLRSRANENDPRDRARLRRVERGIEAMRNLIADRDKVRGA